MFPQTLAFTPQATTTVSSSLLQAFCLPSATSFIAPRTRRTNNNFMTLYMTSSTLENDDRSNAEKNLDESSIFTLSTSTDLTSSSSDGSVSTTLSSLLVDEFEVEKLVQKSFLKQLRVRAEDAPNGGVEDINRFNKTPIIVGHRGSVFKELENTRAGFIKTAELGAEAAELDVFLLKCGTLVVFHGGGTDQNPGDLLDYCGRPGNILDLTYEEALQLKFNPKHEEFGCPADATLRGRIPTLEEVLLDAKKTGLYIKIELKGEGTVEPSLEVVERLDMLDQCSFASFDHSRIAHLRKLRPDKTKYHTGALFNDRPDNILERAQAAGATEIHLRYDTITPEIIQAIHKAGYGSMAWMRGPIGMKSDCLEKYWDVGNEDETMYSALLRTGVQQMCVNQPDVLVQLREKLAALPAY
ncbi:unnamed protein product [Cylindrotheca closterium]|uniref:GP-PDE domain-containing protein n=1 Tax=Cylindrotheca closterium TaxID=2856 RepID=A0AAD2PU95_9STRA|nr:unnamed protein product [Cylindrotheca closterium]